jgi:hypothetical protein
MIAEVTKMTYYYDNESEYNARGIDYDLCDCLNYNEQPFTIENIECVLAVHEGENDGDDWRWIIELKEPVNGNQFAFLQGGCDYTGWD